MINAVYLDTVAQIAHAAMSGMALPSITGKLLTHLPITAIFFAGQAVVTIDANTGKCVIKPKDAPAGAPVLIDTTAELVTVGSDTHYLFEWASADSVELRAFLDAQADPTQPVEMRCEIEYAIDGETARIAFPILMQTSYSRPDDPVPSATSDTSWEWLKQRAPDANGFSHDDPSKTLSVPSVAAQTSAAAEKTTPADTDKIPLIDSGAGGALKWLSWTSIKATLKTYFDGLYSTFSGSWTDLSGKPATFPPSTHSHAISDVSGLQISLNSKVASALIGANSGIAPLDSAGKVPAANLPSYVDDVIEVANLAAMPGTGETGKIYVTLDTNKTYRWSGSAYVEISGMPAFASQAEAEAGSDNTKLMTPLRTAEAIAALAGSGGGGANGMAGFAFINCAIGNDATAALGDPTKPYFNVNAGLAASRALLGAHTAQLYIQNDCSAYSLNLTERLDLLLYGDRSDASILGAVYFDGPNGGVSTITGNGRSRVRLVGLYVNGIDGAAGAAGSGDGGAGGGGGDGQAAHPFVVRAITCDYAASVGGEGGVGGEGAYGGETNNNGGNGGLGGIGARGGDLTFYDCNLAAGTITSSGGAGGNGGSGGGGYTGEFGTGSTGSGGSGGNPGNGGDLSFYNCSANAGGPAVSCPAGVVGYGEGGSGIPGGNGQLTLSWSEIGSYADVAGGTIRMSFHTSTFVDNGAA